MKKKLLVLAVVGLFSLPTYAVAGSCCGQSEQSQTQSQNPGSKVQASCPAAAPASGGVTSQQASKTAKKPQDSSGQQPMEVAKEKK